jgi:hypothetical protein
MYAEGFLMMVKFPFKKIKISWPALICLEKSFLMIYSNIPRP